MPTQIFRNEDVQKIIVEIPENHKHIRTTIVLSNGIELVFQEATIANLVRAFLTLKTHPFSTKITLVGRKVSGQKEGYAEWQLLEIDQSPEIKKQKP
ncbi:MAG: hypothetical protein PWP60_504 [Candidatus Atribacteria bacterium]|jgi:hypothetical protein|nr:hypothetical protein [Candidatus Atribacteria bacterium]MDI3530655.1 hypothetical protein [Candidatus Atribacteria bacterium]